MALTLHYHGTPITPYDVLYTLAGKCFCVSHARPDQVAVVHQIGQSVMLDNGAFSKFTRGGDTDWPAYYEWCDRWLSATTWAVIPDVIDAGSQEQDALIREWPHGHYGAPVWHSSEPLERLYRLCDEWPRVCVGSTDEHWQVLGEPWCAPDGRSVQRPSSTTRPNALAAHAAGDAVGDEALSVREPG